MKDALIRLWLLSPISKVLGSRAEELQRQGANGTEKLHTKKLVAEGKHPTTAQTTLFLSLPSSPNEKTWLRCSLRLTSAIMSFGKIYSYPVRVASASPRPPLPLDES